MEVKDLRVGNLITYKSRADTDVEMEVEMEVEIGDMIRVLEGPEDYDPISLTEKRLLKLGFVKVSNLIPEKDDGSDYSLVIDLPQKGLSVAQIYYYHEDDNTLGSAILVHAKENAYGRQAKEYNWISEHENKYVHQLQNLYFALTGKELEIKNSL